VQGNQHPFDTRSVVPNWFDRLFIAPRNSSYHLGHHLYTGVPWFNLKRLHRELMKVDEIRARARVTHGFWRLLWEFPWSEPKPKAALGTARAEAA
jgi:fatty acid desaturase